MKCIQKQRETNREMKVARYPLFRITDSPLITVSRKNLEVWDYLFTTYHISGVPPPIRKKRGKKLTKSAALKMAFIGIFLGFLSPLFPLSPGGGGYPRIMGNHDTAYESSYEPCYKRKLTPCILSTFGKRRLKSLLIKGEIKLFIRCQKR